jgi:O-antigen ligase
MNIFIWGTVLPTIADASLPLEIIGEEASAERPRLILAYAHPLLAGDLLALAIICVFSSALSRIWKSALIPALFLLLLMTDARGPTGGLLMALAAMGILRMRRNSSRAITLMLAVSVCLAVAMIFQASLPKIFSPLMTDDVSTLNSRTELWARTLSYIPERPIIGFSYYSTRYLLIKDFPWAGHAHNSFIEVMLTTGLIGLSMLCAFVAYLFKSILTTRNSLLLGTTIYCLIQGMLNPLLFYAGLPMFVIALAVLSAVWKSRADAVNRISEMGAA